MRAAICAKIHYADLSTRPSGASELDPLARESGTIALNGCGIGPGIVNLMHQYAAEQLDESDQLLSGFFQPPLLDLTPRYTDPERRGPRGDELSAVLGSSASHQDRLSVLRDSLAIEFLIKMINAFQDDLSVMALGQGQFEPIDPLDQEMEIPGCEDPLRLSAIAPVSRRGIFRL